MSSLSRLTIKERVAHFDAYRIGISWDVLGTTSESTMQLLFRENQSLSGVARAEIEYLHANHPQRAPPISRIAQVRRLLDSPQLSPFVKPMGGSRISRNKNNAGENDATNHNYWENCLFCGSSAGSGRVIIEAHIIEGVKGFSYEGYGKSAGFSDDLNPASSRNYVPLCGTFGHAGSCYDTFDNYKIALLYNPLTSNYYLYTPEKHFNTNLHGRVIKNIPAVFKPYKRLLTARAYATGYMCLDETMLNLPNLTISENLSASSHSEASSCASTSECASASSEPKKRSFETVDRDLPENIKRQKRMERVSSNESTFKKEDLSDSSRDQTLVHAERAASITDI